MLSKKEVTKNLIDIFYEEDVLPQYVYHYTASENIQSIFKNERMRFLLSSDTDFEDILEGKCAEVFLDVALEELVAERVLNDKERSLIESMKPSRKGFLYTSSKGKTEFINSQVVTYIGCFSGTSSSTYMEEKYIKNDNHEGICIQFRTDELNRTRFKGCQVVVRKVLYGREVIDKIKELIRSMLEATGGFESKIFQEIGIGLLNRQLTEMKYIAKTGKYRKENEYRIVVSIPTVKPQECEVYKFEKYNNGILFPIPKCGLSNIINCNINEKDFAEKKSFLSSLGYRVVWCL